jgi:hypothetical protein
MAGISCRQRPARWPPNPQVWGECLAAAGAVSPGIGPAGVANQPLLPVGRASASVTR